MIDYIQKHDITPVIELVKETDDMRHIVGIPIIVITNPLVGEFKENNTWIESYIIKNYKVSKELIVGYHITDQTKKIDIEYFNNKWNGCKMCFIHNHIFKDLEWLLDEYDNTDVINIVDIECTSKSYLDKIKKKFEKTAVLSDGFKKKNKNSEYPESSLFNNYSLGYKDQGLYWYSDYLTVGRKFTEKGWTPNTVAIHYTYKDDKNDIVTMHFKSEESRKEKKIQEKYQEAIEKLIKFMRLHMNDKGYTSSEFYNLYLRDKYPGLGKLKQYSIQHHIESIII